MDSSDDLSSFLETLYPKARADLRRVLIRDQADRDAIRELYGVAADVRGARVTSSMPEATCQAR